MTIHYLSSTHWDREWYQTFQGFRHRLIDMAEGLVIHLERNADYKEFHFDGQTIVLEDINEIRPDITARIDALAKKKRVLLGPWYCMPDEFLVSGEALIRNLMTGHRIAREHGADVWKFGYLCDTFGHIAQMPQILAGFGIHAALVGRGTNEHTTKPFFLWESPDGTRAITNKLPDATGYGDMQTGVFSSNDVCMDEALFKEKAKAHIDARIARSTIPSIVLMDGLDHIPVHAHTMTYVQWIRELYPDAAVVHGGIAALIDGVARMESKLDTKKGELIEPARDVGGYDYLITNTLSSYYPLKKANDEIQARLERVTSMLMAHNAAVGDTKLRPYYELAWKSVLQNHPHDSICGCSIDRVHEDMRYRFAQANDLAGIVEDDLRKRDIEFVSGEKATEEFFRAGKTHPNGELLFRVFNPLPVEQGDVFSFTIDMPTSFSKRFAEPFGYQSKNAFTIEDEDGKILPYRITDIVRNRLSRVHNQFTKRSDACTVTLMATLRASGWTSFIVKPSAVPVRDMRTLMTGPYSAENEYLSLAVGRDGTLVVRDKKNGRAYSGLPVFASDSEIGDGWFHASAVGGATAYDGAAEVSVIENSSRVTFRIIRKLIVPQRMRAEGSIHQEYAGIHASEEKVVVPITVDISLDSGSRLLRMKVIVENTACDHRLRMLLPTGMRGDYFAYQAFCFIERPAGRMFGDTSSWKEMEPIEKNCSNIAGKRDANGGIVFFAKAGIHEVAAFDDAAGTMAFTLLRSFRRTVMQNGEPNGELPGEHVFETALYFSEAGESYGSIYRRYLSFATPLIAHTLPAPEGKPLDRSFISIESEDVVVSTVKHAEDGSQGNTRAIVVRLVNLSDIASPAELKFQGRVANACLAMLDEAVTDGRPAVRGDTVALSVAPWKIVTLRAVVER
ncbi:MAG: glycosyl hydrolase-related protein [Spirochaetota bacterium]